jgi:hypothetical protein
MKTTMQELIEELEKRMKSYLSVDMALSASAIAITLMEAKKLLEKEKEQIMNAYCDGAKGGANGTKGQHENGWVSIQMRNKYYNQTYNQNK